MTGITQLRWYWNRLNSMSPGEVFHRLRERAAKDLGRRIAGWPSFATPDTTLSPLNLSLSSFEASGEMLSDSFRRLHAMARNGTWHYLGYRWPGMPRGIWHLDPKSGKSWPMDRYCFDIDFRHDRTFGDIKLVWEINRLQFLPPIAALALIGGNEEARQYCLQTIEDWISSNPPFMGVNWSSGIELAVRSINLLLTIEMLGHETLSRSFSESVVTCLTAHGYWLERYPSLYSSANNHLVAEAAGLYAIGVALDGNPRAAKWRQKGLETLLAELDKQVLADGVGAEQSPTYLAFTLELVVIALRIAEAQGEDISLNARSRLASAASFLRWITDDNNNQPRIGDDDEGRVIVSSVEREDDYVANVLACVAGAAGAPDLAPPVTRPHLRQLLLGAVATPGQRPQGVKHFDEGGYSVIRQEMAGRQAMLVMDHGPLGYLSIAAHGHADALAVWLHIDGQPVLVDAGTYLYHSGGAERDMMRGTVAHNTLALDDQNQSDISGPFNWSRKAHAWRVGQGDPPDGQARISACHDGYKKTFGLVHHREVTSDSVTGLTIRDWLAGEPKTLDATATIRYLVHPELEITRLSDGKVRLSRDGKPIVEIEMTKAMSMTRKGEVMPISLAIEPACYSPSFGHMVPAHALVARGTARDLLTSAWLTRISLLLPSDSDRRHASMEA